MGGALTNYDRVITPRIKEAPTGAQKAESMVVLASGRPTTGMEPLVKELELSHFGNYILSYNGGMITSCKTGETTFSSSLPREFSQRIIGLVEGHRVDILIYRGGEIIINSKECFYAIAESNINHLPLRQAKGVKSYVDLRIPKFLILDDGGYLVTMESRIKTAMGRGSSVYCSEPYFLETMPKRINKAQSLTRLLRMLGFEREQMMVCDDGYNGLTMIKYAGLGVAIENAVLPVRQTADYITASSNHDGVGAVAEKFMLS